MIHGFDNKWMPGIDCNDYSNVFRFTHPRLSSQLLKDPRKILEV